MIAAVIILAIACVALATRAIVAATSASRAKTRASELETQLAEHQAEATAQREKADAAEAARLAAEASASAATVRADDAERKAREANEKATAAQRKAEAASDRATAEERRAAEAAQRASEADERAATALEQATEAAERAQAADERIATIEREREQLLQLVHPDGSWALDHRRLERLWHDRLSLPWEDGGAPLPPIDDPAEVSSEALQAAVHILTEASREETGVALDLAWKVDQPLSPAVASAVVRLAEELVAAARLSDGGELACAVEADAVVLRLTTDPAIEWPSDLADAIERFAWPMAAAGPTLEARIPLA